MKPQYINKRLAEILATARSCIDRDDFEEAKRIGNYIGSLGYEVTGWKIRHDARIAQKARGILEQ